MAITHRSKMSDAEFSQDSELEELFDAVRENDFQGNRNIISSPQDFEKVNNFFDLVQKSGESVAEMVSPIVETSDEDLATTSQSGNKENLVQEHHEVEFEEASIASSNQDLKQDTLDDFDDLDINNESIDPTFCSDPIMPVGSDVGSKGVPLTEDELKELLQDEYERGFAEASENSQVTFQVERDRTEKLIETLFAVNEEIAQSLSLLIEEKVKQLCGEILGEEINRFPEKYLEKITKTAQQVFKSVESITVELNAEDWETLKKLQFEISKSSIDFVTQSNLNRGEFKISDGLSSILVSQGGGSR